MPIHDFLQKNDKILVLGSGALSIGQAGEFDYSGSQALQALEEEGFQTILVNPNIATIQTSSTDRRTTYLYPVTPHWVEKVIEKEKPRAIVAGFGGQTALNCVLQLEELGILEKYQVKNLGTPLQTLRLTEDRELFARAMQDIDIPIPPSTAISSLEEAEAAMDQIGFPMIIRAAYALGGMGSGFADNKEEARQIVSTALNFSPQVLMEKSLKGWREVEYEVMRDGSGNIITICNMENLDPLGVHTGDSIVIAPSQTLNDQEYQLLRNASRRIVNHLGVVGECNVQLALSPNSKEYYVIEVNARLSRSSALASKATGYPIAYIAAKVVIGYSLLEQKNPVTGSTSAFFEPAMDYAVLKIPRWDLSKFPDAKKQLGSSMKSVGEIMGIGRNFAEALQKSVRMVREDSLGLSLPLLDHEDDLIEELRKPTELRLFAIYQAFKNNMPLETISRESLIDPWFLQKIQEIVLIEEEMRQFFSNCKTPLFPEVEKSIESLLAQVNQDQFIHWKKYGFSDEQILMALIEGREDISIEENNLDRFRKTAGLLVRKARKKLQVVPRIKRIDTTAAEYPAPSNYLYMSYEGSEDDTQAYPAEDSPVLVLGGGSYRIGSSVEFDWCAVMTSQAIAQQGIRSIIINCNPETVSTDFSNSDKLYFEELTTERVLDIYEFEQSRGIVVSMGGQLPNVLTEYLHKGGARLLGHSPETISRAEDRSEFSAVLDSIGIDQPRWKSIFNKEELASFVEEVGFPLLVRPSFVLSGTAMKVAYSEESLYQYLETAAAISPSHPVTVSEFLQDNREIELDGVAQEGKILISFMSEHLENAGVHSGDSTLIYPAQKLYVDTVRQVKQAGTKIAKELQLNGPFNIQFVANKNHIKVIECNARASRSFPFISKVTSVNLAELAAKVITAKSGEKVSAPSFDEFNIPHVGVKAPMFSFQRLEGADPVLGVEMYSTGEVGTLAETFHEALLLSVEATGIKQPKKGVLLSSGRLHEKVKLLESVEVIRKLGIPMYATSGTAYFLEENGYQVESIAWPHESEESNVLDFMQSGKIDFVVNIPKNLETQELKNGSDIRKTATIKGYSLITNAELANAYFAALDSMESFMNNHKVEALKPF
jgi:carbamoyl-phosphate synthase large subunit